MKPAMDREDNIFMPATAKKAKCCNFPYVGDSLSGSTFTRETGESLDPCYQRFLVSER